MYQEGLITPLTLVSRVASFLLTKNGVVILVMEFIEALKYSDVDLGMTLNLESACFYMIMINIRIRS